MTALGLIHGTNLQVLVQGSRVMYLGFMFTDKGLLSIGQTSHRPEKCNLHSKHVNYIFEASWNSIACLGVP